MTQSILLPPCNNILLNCVAVVMDTCKYKYIVYSVVLSAVLLVVSFSFVSMNDWL